MTVAATATPAPTPARREHVYPVDLVRLSTFACVIAVHTLSTVNPVDSVPAGGFAMLLHFTRESFFFLTAFVLVYRHADAGVVVRAFWRRRFLLVGVPYLTWSVIYTALAQLGSGLPPATRLHILVLNVATGAAWYHLYFLLVSMQFYLLFPLFLRLLRATRNHPVGLLAVSGVLELAVTAVSHYLPRPVGPIGALLDNDASIVETYQFYLVLGGVAALHRVRFQRWVAQHCGTVLAALLVTGAAAEATYLAAVHSGVRADFAADVFQPVLVPWCVSAIVGLYALGTAWAARRAGGVGTRLVEGCSDRSFGVFLVHPLALWAVAETPPAWLAHHVPAAASTVVVYLAVVAASLALVEVVRHSPLILVLTGKAPSRTPPMRFPREIPGRGRVSAQESTGT